MPYTPLPLGDHVPAELVSVIRGAIEPFLDEFHFLLTVRRPDQGPKGSLQLLTSVALLSLIDSSAQLLSPGNLSTGDRFKAFLKDNYPWDLDPPGGMSVDEAIEYLWDYARSSLIHRFGLRASRGVHPLIELGNSFTSDDASITKLELHPSRPTSSPSLHKNDERTIIWLESLYWALRIALVRAIDTPEKCHAVIRHLQSGQFDHKARKR